MTPVGGPRRLDATAEPEPKTVRILPRLAERHRPAAAPRPKAV